MNIIPVSKKSHWRKSKWFTEAVASFPPVVTTAVAGISTYSRLPHDAIALFAVSIWYIVAGMLRVNRARIEEAAQSSSHPDSLEGCLHVIHRLVCSNYGIADPKPGQVRIVLHRSVPRNEIPNKEEHFEQVTRYVGGPGGPAGRTTPVNCGIAGKVIRTGRPQFFQRTSEDYGAYLKELMDALSYSKSQAKELTDGRWSCFGVPLFDQDDIEQVIGVVFIDSSDKELFDDLEGTISIIAACQGFNDYLMRRNTKQ